MLLSYRCRHLHHHQYRHHHRYRHYHHQYRHHEYIFQGDRCVGSAISLLWMVVHSVQVGGHLIGHLTVNLHNPDFYSISSRNTVVAPTTPVLSCPNYTLLCNLVIEINVFSPKVLSGNWPERSEANFAKRTGKSSFCIFPQQTYPFHSIVFFKNNSAKII